MTGLALHHIRIRYGHLEAVQGVDLHVGDGERVCLIGANGAGKTTLLKAIAGLLPVHAGQIHFDGHSLLRRAPHDILRHGIALVPEGRGMFNQLSVAENLSLGAYTRTDPLAVRQEINRIYDSWPRLGERRHQPAGQLSGGEQQLLSIQRALLSRPRLLLLDEPTMGLAPLMTEAVFASLDMAHRNGVSILLVEQNARLALAHSDRAAIMETGRIFITGASRALIDDPTVQAAYLGL